MGQQRDPGGLEALHRHAQDGLVAGGELGNSRVAHEGLAAEDPGLGQRYELVFVARHHAAPKADVDVQLISTRIELDPQRLDRRRDGQAVERHIDERRDPARRRRPRAGGEALPLRATGLVDVHVAVDDARHHHEVPVVDDAGVAGHLLARHHGRDPTVVEHDSGGLDVSTGDDARADDRLHA